GVGAAQQRAAPRAFPFSVFLLELPRLELVATPPKIFRGDAMQSREGRDAKARENLWRNLIKKPGPASKRARRLVVQFAAVSKKLQLGRADLFHDRVCHAVEHLPNCLAAIVTNALGPGRNFPEDF